MPILGKYLKNAIYDENARKMRMQSPHIYSEIACAEENAAH